MNALLARSSLFAPVRQVLADARQLHSASALARIEELVATFTGQKPIEIADAAQRPELAFFPGITNRPFFPDQPWTAALNGHAPAIRAELLQHIEEHKLFQPYLTDADNAARKGRFGAGIKDANDWTVAMLDVGGKRHENAALFPETMKALGEVFPGQSATTQELSYAVFSALKPGAHIPPHCGASNIKLTGHLGLIVPKGRCEIRVANETRGWEEGKTLLFDDTYEHEVWQQAESPRVVLMFWTYHPDLTAVEVEVLKKLIVAAKHSITHTLIPLSLHVS